MKIITIGRSTENNDIVVNDEKVSRNHLQMVMDDNGNYSVVDLGSTNGTYVNGRRIYGEVRLKLGDEVKIGQTVLPWQNYFAISSQTPIVKSPLSPQSPQPNPNRTWVYIVIGAILLLLIGGGVAWKIYHDKQKEKIEQEEKKKEQQERQLEQEANDARVEAARLSEEAEAAARKAAETKSEKDKKAAETAAKKAEDASRLAQKKESEWKKMKVELDAANEAKKAAEDKSEEDAKAKEKAEQEARLAQDRANKAKMAQDEAEQKAEFYMLISQVKPKIWMFETDYFQKVCKELKWTSKEDEDKKEFIIREFENGDQVQRQRIIDAIKKVLEQQRKDTNVSTTESGHTKENEELIEVPTNDTIVIKSQDTID